MANIPNPNSNASKILSVVSPEQELTEEEIVVKAFKRYPNDFGLAGYQSLYPDNNKVRSYIVGNRGLVAQGRLAKTGPKKYKLPDSAITKNMVPYWHSELFQAYQTDGPAAVTYKMFLRFCGLSSCDVGRDAKAALRQVERIDQKLRQAIGEDSKLQLLYNAWEACRARHEKQIHRSKRNGSASRSSD